MTALRYARRALDDLERLIDFLIDDSPADALATYELIESALVALERHPLIGRPVEAGLRELVISRGRTGYLALYRYDEVRDEALVLTIKHQREAGFQT
ncbi:MAG: type II toxin-antitoxin system RelE/ParE family toxin [Rhodocyclaceae bacterium]|nr:type II toxin-antitoxin system RelE/ParE family toxin [Rhodocyclaceae bacterium]MCB1963312.1 type II toxin-antitoxin system RelE/ParE family toxin [Rhodocyclaceae bacterium]